MKSRRCDHTMGDNAHITDVGGLVHEGPDLVCDAEVSILHVCFRDLGDVATDRR